MRAAVGPILRGGPPAESNQSCHSRPPSGPEIFRAGAGPAPGAIFIPISFKKLKKTSPIGRADGPVPPLTAHRITGPCAGLRTNRITPGNQRLIFFARVGLPPFQGAVLFCRFFPTGSAESQAPPRGIVLTINTYAIIVRIRDETESGAAAASQRESRAVSYIDCELRSRSVFLARACVSSFFVFGLWCRQRIFIHIFTVRIPTHPRDIDAGRLKSQSEKPNPKVVVRNLERSPTRHARYLLLAHHQGGSQRTHSANFEIVREERLDEPVRNNGVYV